MAKAPVKVLQTIIKHKEVISEAIEYKLKIIELVLKNKELNIREKEVDLQFRQLEAMERVELERIRSELQTTMQFLENQATHQQQKHEEIMRKLSLFEGTILTINNALEALIAEGKVQDIGKCLDAQIELAKVIRDL